MFRFCENERTYVRDTGKKTRTIRTNCQEIDFHKSRCIDKFLAKKAIHKRIIAKKGLLWQHNDCSLHDERRPNSLWCNHANEITTSFQAKGQKVLHLTTFLHFFYCNMWLKLLGEPFGRSVLSVLQLRHCTARHCANVTLGAAFLEACYCWMTHNETPNDVSKSDTLYQDCALLSGAKNLTSKKSSAQDDCEMMRNEVQ